MFRTLETGPSEPSCGGLASLWLSWHFDAGSLANEAAHLPYLSKIRGNCAWASPDLTVITRRSGVAAHDWSLPSYVFLILKDAQTLQEPLLTPCHFADMDCRPCHPCARGRSRFYGRNGIWQKLCHQGPDRPGRYCSRTRLNVKYVPRAWLDSPLSFDRCLSSTSTLQPLRALPRTAAISTAHDSSSSTRLASTTHIGTRTPFSARLRIG